jgi:hypothetical protein
MKRMIYVLLFQESMQDNPVVGAFDDPQKLEAEFWRIAKLMDIDLQDVERDENEQLYYNDHDMLMEVWLRDLNGNILEVE